MQIWLLAARGNTLLSMTALVEKWNPFLSADIKISGCIGDEENGIFTYNLEWLLHNYLSIINKKTSQWRNEVSWVIRVNTTSNGTSRHHVRCEEQHFCGVTAKETFMKSNHEETSDNSNWATYYKITGLYVSKMSRSRNTKKGHKYVPDEEGTKGHQPTACMLLNRVKIEL